MLGLWCNVDSFHYLFTLIAMQSGMSDEAMQLWAGWLTVRCAICPDSRTAALHAYKLEQENCQLYVLLSGLLIGVALCRSEVRCAGLSLIERPRGFGNSEEFVLHIMSTKLYVGNLSWGATRDDLYGCDAS